MRTRVKRRQRREVEKPRVRARAPVRESALPAVVETALRSPARPLDPATRASMEQTLSHHLDDVRIHTGPDAEAAAAALEAEAFTSGRDLVFASERYRPETPEGRRLLAHELVHALQQGLGSNGGQALQVGGVAVSSSDPLEREADAAADEVTAGGRLPPGFVSVGTPAAQNRIARQATAAVARQAAVEVPESPEAVAAVAGQIERLLLFDPGDLFGRVRRRLVRMPSATRRTVLGQVQGRVSATAQTTLNAILSELEPSPAEAERPEALREESLPAAEAEAPAAVAEDPAAEKEEAPEPDPTASLESEPGPEAQEFTVPPPAAEPDSIRAGSAPPLEAAELEAEPAEAAPAAGVEAEAAPAAAEAPAEAAAAPRTAPEAAGPSEADANTEPLDELETEALDTVEDDEAGAVEAEGGEPSPGVAGEVPSAPEAVDPDLAAEAETGPGAGTTEPAESEAQPIDEEAAAAEGPQGEPPAPEAEPDLPEPPEEEPDVEEEVAQEPATAEAEDGPTTAGEPEAPETGEAEGAGELDVAPEGALEEPGEPSLTDEGAAPEADADDAYVPPPGGDETGTPIEDAPEPVVPDLADHDPVDAMKVACSLPPAQSQAALAGVSAASSRSVDEMRTDLAENPPQLERPSGAPSPEERLAEEAALPPAAAALAQVERAPAAPAAPPVEVAPLPPPVAPVTQAIAPPVVPGGPQGEITQDDARALQRSLRALPKTDPELHRKAGPPPPLVLEGNADPARAREQRARLDEAARGAQVEGRRDVVEPMGETQLYPDVPPETLRAAVVPTAPAGASPPAAGAPTEGVAAPAAAGGPAPDGAKALSTIAREERGSELRGAAGIAKADMVARQREQQAKAGEEHAKSQAEIADLVRTNAADQATERRRTRLGVHEQRVEWSRGQKGAVDRAGTGADAEMHSAATDIEREQTSGEREAAGDIQQGDLEADTERRKGEEEAERERKRGEEESSGFFGWLAKKASDFFDAIKEGIKRAFDAARTAVRAAIDKAKRFAVAAIEKARSAIVAVVQRVGDALIAIGDTLLAEFPALRDRFRNAIKKGVDFAVVKINQYAEALKVGVQKALDLLGAALAAALGLLEKGLLFAVDVYAKAVQGAIKFAEGVYNALAAFALLIDDISPDPLRWSANLGASAKDGVRNHLWTAFKKAVKRWFNEKLEEVLGLGLTVWNLLKKGGIPLARIGTMVWEGLKAAIPPTLIQLIIEKLVAMIVPAAGAILTIIEGLRAAWGTVQRILEAFERFFRFLKAVKTGRAGVQFAEAVAAAAIVVIDFVANWLLMRLRKPAGALAKRIRAIAQRLGKRLGALGKRLGRAFKFKPGRAKARKPRTTKTKKPKPDKRAKAQRRVDAAASFMSRQLARGLPYPVLWLQMGYARARYRVRLRLKDREQTAVLSVEANPRTPIPLVKKPKAGDPDVNDYRERARRFLGWIAKHHDLHHILPKETNLSRWWNALRIDFNHPTMMLELPPFLHQSGVHRGWIRIRDELSKEEHEKAVKALKYGWNAEWDVWMRARMESRRIYTAEELRKKSAQVRQNVSDEIDRRIDYMLGIFSAKVRYDLRKFRVTAGRGAPYREKYRRKMASFINGLRKYRNSMQIRAWISSWLKGRRLSARLTKRQARALLKYWRARG